MQRGNARLRRSSPAISSNVRPEHVHVHVEALIDRTIGPATKRLGFWV